MDISTIFDHLVEDKTLVSIEMVDGNFETLTLIIDAMEEKKEKFFCLEATDDFVRAIRGERDYRLKFEFTGRDKVRYSFFTTGGEIREDLVRIGFPDKIERDQKRGDFRVAPFIETKFYPRLKGKKLSMDVINLSMGGALVMLDRGVESAPTLNVDHKLLNAEMVFPGSENRKSTRLVIKRALLIRVEDGPTKNRYKYAVKFLKVDFNNQKELRQRIYDIQREELRRKKLRE